MGDAARGFWTNRHGILRAPWRIALFCLLSAAIVAVVFGVFSPVRRILQAIVPPALRSGLLSPEVLVGNALLAGSIFLASAILVRFVDRRPVAGIGLGFHGRWAKELALGVLLGAISISAMAAVLAAAGCLTFALSGASGAAWAGGLVLQGLLFAGVALAEELLFRGYPLQVVSEGTGKAPAAVLLSALFGCVHASNPGGNVTAALATGGAGLILSLAYFRTRSLWLPIGIHAGWNFFLGSVLSLPVSGEPLPDTLLTSKLSGPEWMTGGTFGPEASVPSFVVMGILAVYLGRSRRIAPAPEALAWYPPEETRRPRPAPGPGAGAEPPARGGDGDL